MKYNPVLRTLICTAYTILLLGPAALSIIIGPNLIFAGLTVIYFAAAVILFPKARKDWNL